MSFSFKLLGAAALVAGGMGLTSAANAAPVAPASGLAVSGLIEQVAEALAYSHTTANGHAVFFVAGGVSPCPPDAPLNRRRSGAGFPRGFPERRHQADLAAT